MFGNSRGAGDRFAGAAFVFSPLPAITVLLLPSFLIEILNQSPIE
jgi:hypothetical protein